MGWRGRLCTTFWGASPCRAWESSFSGEVKQPARLFQRRAPAPAVDPMRPPAGWPDSALAGLPALRRQVFLLRVRDGLPLATVAARTGLTRAQAGALLVLASRAVAPPGALDAGWVLDARARLRAGHDADVPAVRSRGTRAWPLVAALAVLAAAAGAWWLREAPPPAAPVETASTPAAAPAAPVPALTPAEAALAAPDLALVQRVEEDRELLESLAFYRWLAEQQHER